MKALLSPLALVFAAVAVAGGIFNSIPVLAIGAILWVGSIAFLSSRQAQRQGLMTDLSELSPDARILFRPIRQAHEDLIAIVQRGSSDPTVKVVGEEAISESAQIADQAFRMAQSRSQLEKTLKGRSVAELEIKRLNEKIANSTSQEELDALKSALSAHQSEYNHYEQVTTSMATIDNKLREAQAALSELKARIAVGAADTSAAQAGEDELGEIMGRLKSLSASFDEAEAMNQETTR